MAANEDDDEELIEHLCAWKWHVNEGTWKCPNTSCLCSFFVLNAFIEHLESCRCDNGKYSNAVLSSSGIPCCFCHGILPLHKLPDHVKSSHNEVYLALENINNGKRTLCHYCNKGFHDGIAFLKHTALCKHQKSSQPCKKNEDDAICGQNIKDPTTPESETKFFVTIPEMTSPIITTPINTISAPKRPNKAQLTKYLKKWYGNVRFGVFCCPNGQCGQTFFISGAFAAHLKACTSKEPFNKRVVQDDQLPCPLCDADLSLDSYGKHFNESHKQVSKDLEELAMNRKVTCPNYICKVVFESGPEYLRHSVFCKPAHLCSKCKQVFPTLAGLERHICTEKDEGIDKKDSKVYPDSSKRRSARHLVCQESKATKNKAIEALDFTALQITNTTPKTGRSKKNCSSTKKNKKNDINDEKCASESSVLSAEDRESTGNDHSLQDYICDTNGTAGSMLPVGKPKNECDEDSTKHNLRQRKSRSFNVGDQNNDLKVFVHRTTAEKQCLPRESKRRSKSTEKKESYKEHGIVNQQRRNMSPGNIMSQSSHLEESTIRDQNDTELKVPKGVNPNKEFVRKADKKKNKTKIQLIGEEIGEKWEQDQVISEAQNSLDPGKETVRCRSQQGRKRKSHVADTVPSKKKSNNSNKNSNLRNIDYQEGENCIEQQGKSKRLKKKGGNIKGICTENERLRDIKSCDKNKRNDCAAVVGGRGPKRKKDVDSGKVEMNYETLEGSTVQAFCSEIADHTNIGVEFSAHEKRKGNLKEPKRKSAKRLHNNAKETDGTSFSDMSSLPDSQTHGATPSKRSSVKKSSDAPNREGKHFSKPRQKRKAKTIEELVSDSSKESSQSSYVKKRGSRRKEVQLSSPSSCPLSDKEDEKIDLTAEGLQTEEQNIPQTKSKRGRKKPTKPKIRSLEMQLESTFVESDNLNVSHDMVLNESVQDTVITEDDLDSSAFSLETSITKTVRKCGRKKKGKRGPQPIVQEEFSVALEEFEKSSDLQILYSNWLKDTGNGDLHCPHTDCEIVFQCPTKMLRHMRKCTEAVSRVAYNKDDFPCCVCQQSQTVKDYLTHIRTIHSSFYRMCVWLDNGVLPCCENYKCNEKVNNVKEAAEHGGKCMFLQQCPLCKRELKGLITSESHSCGIDPSGFLKPVLKMEDGCYSFVTESVEPENKRQLKAKRKSFAGLDQNGEEEDAEGDYFKDENSSSEDDERIRSRKPPTGYKKGAVQLLVSDKKVTLSEHSVFKPDTSNFEFYKSWLGEHHSTELFLDYMPNLSMFEIVDERDYHEYIPSSKTSARFDIKYDTKKDHGVSTDEFRLPLFGSTPPLKGADGQTFYVGGPVWAMDWCPCPGTTDQYLAVSTHKNHVDVFSFHDAENHNGLIQIWNTGRRCTPRSVVSPRMVLGIAHNFNPVYCIKWCPSGTWEACAEVNGSNKLNRLGLLAVTCGDGAVRILSIPYPEQLSQIYKVDENSLLIVKIAPSLILTMTNDLSSATCKVLDLSWLPTKGHGKIAGGFANGNVCIWKIDKLYSLLTTDSKDAVTKHVLPSLCFPAHDSSAKYVTWCPSDTNFILTAGADRCYKITDLRNPIASAFVCRRGFPTGIMYSLYHSGFFTSEDDAFHCIPSGARYYHLLMNTQKDTPCANTMIVTRHLVCTKAMGSNDWLDLLTTGCDNGLLALRPLFGDTHVYKRVVNLYKIEQDVIDEEDNVNTSEDKSCQSNLPTRIKDKIDKLLLQCCSKNYENDFDIFRDAAERAAELMNASKYTFNDFNFLEFRLEPKCCLNPMLKYRNVVSMDTEDQRLFSTQAIHRVSWNPNHSSHIWLASGGFLGLIRLHPFWAWKLP